MVNIKRSVIALVPRSLMAGESDRQGETPLVVIICVEDNSYDFDHNIEDDNNDNFDYVDAIVLIIGHDNMYGR